MYGIEATHSHLEKPVSPKHPRYPKVVQAARHVTEGNPIQEESILIPIHYERPSVCLQRERPCSVEVCRRGGRRCGLVDVCQEQRDGTTSSAECFVIFTLSPTPDLIRPHRRLGQSSYLTWGSSSSIRSSSSREGRQSGFLSAMALRLSRGGFLGGNFSEQGGAETTSSCQAISLDFVSRYSINL